MIWPSHPRSRADPSAPRCSFCALVDEGQPAVHPGGAGLYPEARDRRRREFLLGRAAAHQAIAALCGGSEQPIGRGPRGQPLWPAGLVGSISHTRGLALAAVARRRAQQRPRRRRGAPRSPRPAGGVRRVASPAEQAWIEADGPDLRLKLLFSAKEAIFKALYPLAEVFFGYKQAELCRAARRRRVHCQAARRRGRRPGRREASCRSAGGSTTSTS